MKINNNASLDSLFVLLEHAKIEVSEENKKYSSAIYFNIEDILPEQAEILVHFMRFHIKKNTLSYQLLNAANKIIYFDSKLIANITTEQIKNNLSRQLSFSIFRKTGIKILPKTKVSDNIPIKFI